MSCGILTLQRSKGYRDSLQDAVGQMPAECTRLVLDILGDTDDFYSAIAYEQGFLFLLTLERLVGTEQFEGVILPGVYWTVCVLLSNNRRRIQRLLSRIFQRKRKNKQNQLGSLDSSGSSYFAR
jgi:hypothetical protein